MIILVDPSLALSRDACRSCDYLVCEHRIVMQWWRVVSLGNVVLKLDGGGESAGRLFLNNSGLEE